jgi:hypothetical protein
MNTYCQIKTFAVLRRARLAAAALALLAGCGEQHAMPPGMSWQKATQSLGVTVKEGADQYRTTKRVGVSGIWTEYALRLSTTVNSCADLGIRKEPDFVPYDTYRSLLFEDIFWGHKDALCSTTGIAEGKQISVFSDLHYVLVVVRANK